MIFTYDDIEGPDVSMYQDDNNTPQKINFVKMKDAKVNFVIIRAGQNLWIDPDFIDNWNNAKIAGLLRGAYWFYDSRADPIKQANLFASLFINDPPEMELWLDLEENYGGAFGGWTNWKKFINQLRQRLPNARIGIYTGYYYINGKIPVSEYFYFGQFLLWLAWYTTNPSIVLVPRPWVSVIFWQWGTPAWGVQFGCESIEIDMNKFNGTKNDFNVRYGGATIPPTSGGTMKGIVKKGYSVNIRSSADEILGTLVVGDIVYGNVANNRIYYNKVYRANGTIDNLEGSSIVGSGTTTPVYYMILTQEDEPTQPPTPEPDPVLVKLEHTILVYSDGSITVDGNPIP